MSARSRPVRGAFYDEASGYAAKARVPLSPSIVVIGQETPVADLEPRLLGDRVMGDMRIVRPFAVGVADPHVVVVTILRRAPGLLFTVSILYGHDASRRRRHAIRRVPVEARAQPRSDRCA